MIEVKELYYTLKNNEEYNKVLVKSFYQFKDEKLHEEEILEILEEWLRDKKLIKDINYFVLVSLYKILRYDILVTHNFQF